MILRALVTSLLAVGTIAAPPALAAAANEPIQPIEAAKPKNENKVELGKMLFFDPAFPNPASSRATPVIT